MQDFNFIKQQFLSLQIPINEHYLNRYIKFILALPELKRKDGYCESHHILPKAKSLFPQYEKKNIAPWNQKKIDARAHQICHWILWMALPGNRAMHSGFWHLANIRKGELISRVNSRAYRNAKEEHSLWMSNRLVSKETREKLRQANLGKTASLVTKSIMSINNVGFKGMAHTEENKKKMRDLKIDISLSDEHKINLSIASLGKPKSDKHKENIRANHVGNRGMKWSAEQREKMKIAQQIRRARERDATESSS